MEFKRNGVLILDGRGTPVYATGSGADKAVQAALAERWNARVRQPLAAMFTLDALSVPLVALHHASEGTGCFMLFPSGQADPLFEFAGNVDFAADIMRHFVTNPYEAITVVDAQGKIRYLSPVHERFFGMAHGEAIGRDVTEVIENTRLRSVISSGKAEIGQIQRMRGTSRVVNRTPIQDTEGRIVGAIGQVMFKSPSALETLNEEVRRLRREIRFYERELPQLRGEPQGLDAIVGVSDPIQKLKEQIRKVARLQVSVLLVGESGVGKDLVAHAIHHASDRANRDMVLINAAAIAPNLVEAELFGYEGGAFTGAEKRGRTGKFEQADKTSLFLDEIGDMPLDVQVKLLRTLQDGTFQRVGGQQLRKSDFRLISASNRDFRKMLADGEFRLDLFYRISAVTIRVPPLRERTQDIPLLAQTFLDCFCERHQMSGKYFGPGVLAHLQSLPWPGNVRQLQHTIERAAIFSEGDEITVADCELPVEADSPGAHVDNALQAILGESELATASHAAAGATALDEPERPVDLRRARQRVEMDMIREALDRFNGNKKRTAEYLGMSRSQLYKRLEQFEEARM